MASFAHEAAVTKRLLDVLGVPYSNLDDPMQIYGGHETGADVQIEHAGRQIGIQVTDFSADEGVGDPRRSLRATEKRNAAQGRFPTYSIPLQHQRAALQRRIRAKLKIAAGHDFKEFDEVWLLVSASLARPDSIASTFIVTPFLTADDLNCDLDAELKRSKYDRAFVHVQVGDSVYEWTRGPGRQLVHSEPPPEPQRSGELWFMPYLRDPSLVGEVPPHPKVVAMMCDACGGPFTREQPRREPAGADGRYVHANPDYCARLRRVTVRTVPGMP